MSSPMILILSCPDDGSWLLRLLTYLRPYERQGMLATWDESRTLPGESTRAAFREALRSARAVVLLVSSDLIASDFIANERLPELLELVRKDALRLLSVFVRPALTLLSYREPESDRIATFDLQAYKALNSASSAMSELRRPQQEKEFVRIAAAIQGAVPSMASSWVGALAEAIDAVPAQRFMDCSSRRPTRILCKLETLFDLPATLSELEKDVLVASAYVQTLRDATGAVELLSPSSIPSQLRPWVDRVIAQTASATEPSDELSAVRCGLLSGLLQLGCALDCDHASMHSEAALPAEPAEWLVYFTREARVRRGGVVTFCLSPTQKGLGPSLRRAVALGFELVWQRVRPILTESGLALAIAPCIEDPRTGAAPEPGWQAWLDERARWVEQQVALQRIQHLGDELALPVEALLPLPETAVLDSVSLFLDRGWDYFLELRNDRDEVLTIELPQSDEEIRRVSLHELPPGIWSWSVGVDYGTGSLQTVSFGRLRRLTAQERTAVAEGRRGFDPAQLALLTRYGLHDEILRELWPRLIGPGPDPAPEELLLAFRLVTAAYRFIEKFCPASRQLERYGHASTWLSEQLGLESAAPSAPSERKSI